MVGGGGGGGGGMNGGSGGGGGGGGGGGVESEPQTLLVHTFVVVAWACLLSVHGRCEHAFLRRIPLYPRMRLFVATAWALVYVVAWGVGQGGGGRCRCDGVGCVHTACALF